MATATEYDTTKLPIWAQKLLESKDHEIRDLTVERDAARALFAMEPNENLDPSWDVPRVAHLDPHRHMLPIGTGHVRYQVDDEFSYIETRAFQQYNGRDRPKVNCVYVTGARTLSVEPVASNALRLFLAAR